MRVLCFLMSLPDRSPDLAPVARLALSCEEAAHHPLRASDIRETDISAHPQRLDPSFAPLPGGHSGR